MWGVSGAAAESFGGAIAGGGTTGAGAAGAGGGAVDLAMPLTCWVGKASSPPPSRVTMMRDPSMR